MMSTRGTTFSPEGANASGRQTEGRERGAKRCLRSNNSSAHSASTERSLELRPFRSIGSSLSHWQD